MAKKKQKDTQNKKQEKQKPLQTSPQEKKNTPATSDVGKKQKVVILPEKTQNQATGKKNIGHAMDPWAIGIVVFGLAIIFTLLFSTAFATGIKSKVQNVSQIVVDSIQDSIGEPVETDDGKIEALDGTRLDPADLNYPVAVMIDNLSAARPQSNIQNASVVYETLVESGITRFMAIFDHGVYDKIGPVRSARPYYVQWADAIDAGYMHAGGSPEALFKINEYGVKDINRGQYYWRDSGRPAPHNLYTSSELMMRALRDLEWLDDPQNFSRWKFDDDPEKGTKDNGGNIDLFFAGSAESSHVRWEYIPDQKKYKRFQAGQSHEDASTGDQLKASTVVVQIIPPIVSVGSGGRLTLNVIGEGKAHVVFQGKRIEGTWKKPEITSRTTFYDENGNEVVFPRGTIFVEVIPEDRQVTFE